MSKVFDLKKFNHYYLHQNEKLNNNEFENHQDYLISKLKDGLIKNNVDINDSPFYPFKPLSSEHFIVEIFTKCLIDFQLLVKESRDDLKQEQEVGHLLGTILEDDPNFFMVDEEVLDKRITNINNQINKLKSLIDYKENSNDKDIIYYYYENILFLIKVYSLTEGANFFNYYLEDGLKEKRQYLKMIKELKSRYVDLLPDNIIKMEYIWVTLQYLENWFTQDIKFSNDRGTTIKNFFSPKSEFLECLWVYYHFQRSDGLLAIKRDVFNKFRKEQYKELKMYYHDIGVDQFDSYAQLIQKEVLKNLYYTLWC